MSPEQAPAAALAAAGASSVAADRPAPARPPAGDGLARREVEVLRQVAAGGGDR
jgi:hypothetical protein